MDLETAQTTTTAKLPILKQGEYDMWRLRIEQYFQVQDYALWDVIENGNSFKLVAQTTTNVNGTSTTLITGAYKDAKTLFAAIQTRFGGNEATKKTQKTLLKQMYENFSAPSSGVFDFFLIGFRRLNKHDLDTMSFDDLYNNFMIVEQVVKGTASSSSSSSFQNMAFVSSLSSTNEVNIAYGVSTTNTQVSPASTQVSTASTQVSTANLSDDTVYAFLASQPNSEWLDDGQVQAWSVLTAIRWGHLQGYNAEDIGTKIAGTGNQDKSRGTINVEKLLPKPWWLLMELVLIRAIWQMMKSLQTCLLWLFQTLSSGLEEFKQPEFEGYGTKSVSEDIYNEVRESPDAPLVEELV
ncbi:hypothetical protein Tco_0719699 [Tanacetum coccineum]